jgi:protein TonB
MRFGRLIRCRKSGWSKKRRFACAEPVGAADPEFLAAARRHIIRSWRYKPATEDGVAVPTSIVISLAFRLEDA